MKRGTSNRSNKDASGVQTISLTSTEPLDLIAFNKWLFHSLIHSVIHSLTHILARQRVSEFLRTSGQDVYRMKGILHMENHEEQFMVVLSRSLIPVSLINR